MAIATRAQNGEIRYGVNDYILDSPDDLAQLKRIPCAAGSSALILSSFQVYFKNTQGEWVEIK